MFLDSLSYPLRDHAWIMLIIGGFILTAESILSGFGGLFGLIMWGSISSYIGAYCLQIVDRTITGSDDSPEWPDISGGLMDLVQPAGRMIGLLLLSFGPHLALRYFMEDGTGTYDLLYTATLIWAVIYFPMSIVCAQNFGSLAAALPHKVIPAMFRLMPGYLAAVGFLAFMAVVGVAFTAFARGVLIVGPFAAGAVWLYFLTFYCRFIGLLCRENLDRLGWDDDEPAAPAPVVPAASAASE